MMQSDLDVWSLLPEDCVHLIVWFCARHPYHHHNNKNVDSLLLFKTRLTLSLLNRSMQEKYREAWIVSTSGDRLATCFSQIVRSHPFLPSNLSLSSSWLSQPTLRLAEMGKVYYDQMVALSSTLRGKQEYFVNFVYKPVGGESVVRMRHEDYHKVKDLLKNIQRYRSRLQPHEQLQFFLALVRYGKASYDTQIINITEPGDHTELRDLYLYNQSMVVEDSTVHCMTYKHREYDPRRLVPLEQALRKGITQSCTLMRVTNVTRFKGSLTEQWHRRLKQMSLYRKPLRKLLKLCKLRKKIAKKEKRRV